MGPSVPDTKTSLHLKRTKTVGGRRPVDSPQHDSLTVGTLEAATAAIPSLRDAFWPIDIGVHGRLSLAL